MAHRPRLACYLFLQIKFYYNTATPILIHTVCGCFQAVRAELNSCDQHLIAHRAKNIRSLALYKKNMLTTSLDYAKRNQFLIEKGFDLIRHSEQCLTQPGFSNILVE